MILTPLVDRSEMLPALYCNFGPSQRIRKEAIISSVLGAEQGSIHCLKVISLGLDFGTYVPVKWMDRLLLEEGLCSPEELRDHYMTIFTKCVCHASRNPAPIRVENATRKQVLHQALLLGLCTATFFDPSRPVIWTDSSLRRCIDLFDIQEFYL
jgi:hypothetical protein